MRPRTSLGFVVFAFIFGACASAPPVAPKAPVIAPNQKMSWILRLEDQRVLRVPAAAPIVVAPVPANQKKARSLPPPPPVITPDLGVLVTDPEPRIRRRAALAVGRVALPEGAALLQPLLADTDAEVREMAAFALGLLADKTAVPVLTTALADADPRVRGRAAEALGLIGDAASAPAVGQMVATAIARGAIGSIAPDDEQWGKNPEADAVRLGLFALVRQKGYEPLASAVQDPSGRVPGWWPVAYAFQRAGDRRALPLLQQLARTPGRYTRAFAARGLGALKDASSAPLLRSMLEPAAADPLVTASIVRALGQVGAAESVEALLAILTNPRADANVRLEALSALAALKSAAALPYVQALLTDEWPALRAAAVRAAGAIDPDGFLVLLSGLEPDEHWSVRDAVADVLAAIPDEPATDRLRAMLDDQDKRVLPSVIAGLTQRKAAGLDALLITQLTSADTGIRAAAATALGELRPARGAAALRDAYRAAESDSSSDVRDAVLTALAAYGAPEAVDTLKTALTARDWALRLKAAALLKRLDPSIEATEAIRPAPASTTYDSSDLVEPRVSPHAFLETAKGTIEIELSVLDAPQTTRNFITLARKGYFNGLQVHRVVPNFVIQTGDPRGDGSGGPGYSIRDELNERPYVRGTVGMALSGPDTGGSQFFITHSPQPHLDAKYTVFGHVVSGMEIVDRIQQLDVIQRVRIWDGKELK